MIVYEENRLDYVGITRSKRFFKLFCNYSEPLSYIRKTAR